MDFSFLEGKETSIIKVVGIGIAGCGAVNHIMPTYRDKVGFIAVGSDEERLATSKAHCTLNINHDLTEKIDACIENTDMLILVSGLEDETIGNAALQFVRASIKKGVLIIPVHVQAEASQAANATAQIHEQLEYFSEVGTKAIVITSEQAMGLNGKNEPSLSPTERIHHAYAQVIYAMTQSFLKPSFFAIGFADVEQLLKGEGPKTLGLGCARGKNRAEDAVKQAVVSTCLSFSKMQCASGFLLTITASESSITMRELDKLHSTFMDVVKYKDTCVITTIIIFDETVGDDLQVHLLVR